MLQIRYNAVFNPTEETERTAELLLSLTTIEYFIAAFVPVEIVLYTMSGDQATYQRLLAHTTLTSRVIALDTEYPEQLKRWRDFAATIKHCSDVDWICIVRMLFDTLLLDPKRHRLLLGADVIFLAAPQEVLSFVWNTPRDIGVLYMQDIRSCDGTPYRLRYYAPPILEGMVGDFYCLAPGVGLTENAVIGCLRMIDSWPTEYSRWQPPIETNGQHHACEQQATAILLYNSGGQALPTERYSHIDFQIYTIVAHTHYPSDLFVRLPKHLLQRYQSLLKQILSPS